MLRLGDANFRYCSSWLIEASFVYPWATTGSWFLWCQENSTLCSNPDTVNKSNLVSKQWWFFGSCKSGSRLGQLFFMIHGCVAWALGTKIIEVFLYYFLYYFSIISLFRRPYLLRWSHAQKLYERRKGEWGTVSQMDLLWKAVIINWIRLKIE